MDALTVVMTRRSTRNYVNVPLMDGQIETLVKAASRAPKAGEFHIAAVTNEGVLRECDELALQCMKDSGNEFLMGRAALPGYRPLYGAPFLMMLSGPEANPYSLANASCAATAATIAATAMGLGSCYVVTPTLALAASPELARRAGVPADYKAQCCVLAGFSGEGGAYDTERTEFTNVSYCK